MDYKLSLMDQVDERAKALGIKASETVEDMGRVGIELMSVTNEMKVIADGLGSGVTKDQIKTSIDYGKTFMVLMHIKLDN